MELLSTIWERLLLLSVLAVPLLIIIIIFRTLFSQISKRYVLLLWAVLALRLVCPVVIHNPFSVLPAFSGNTIDNVFSFVGKELPLMVSFLKQDVSVSSIKKKDMQEAFAPSENQGAENRIVSKKQAMSENVAENEKQGVSQGMTQNREQALSDSMALNKEQMPSSNMSEGEEADESKLEGTALIPIIWLLVCCLLWGHGLLRGILLRYKLLDAIPLLKGVYSSDRIKEPFACGIVRPRIYLPSGMAQEHKGAVLSHEWEHIRHQDTRINVLAYVIVCLYWFSPLMLAAYFLFLVDLEMACDERVVEHLNGGDKQSYANALLACGSGHLFPGFYPVAFGESGISKRIQNIIKGQSLSKGAAKGMILLVLMLALCFGSGCERLVLDSKDGNSQPKETQALPSQQMNQRTIEWKEEVTGDNKQDIITVDVSAVTDEKGEILSGEHYKADGKEKTVRVTSGKTGEEIYSVNMNPVKHRGGLYLYKKTLSHWMSVEPEKTLFLLWEPPASKDDELYHYEIFSLTEQGEKRIEEQHDFTREEKLANRDMTYLEQVNEYLFHSVVLIDTVGGITQYSKEQEQMTLLYDAGEDCQKQNMLGAARDSKEESDFIRIKQNGWNPLQSAYPGIPFYVACQEEWQCSNHRFRVYFHCEDKDTEFFGYRNEEEIEAREREELYKEQFIGVNSWELEPGWAPYIIWSPPSGTDYKEHIGAYYVTAYVVDEQETKLLAKQTIVIEWREDENKIMSCYVKE